MRRVGRIGVYGAKTRCLQRRLSFEAFGLTFKTANVYLYLGSRAEAVPSVGDIQSMSFFEVPDRAYSATPIEIPIGMELIPETKTDFSRFGIINPLQDESTFRVHVDDMKPLGRSLMVGDIFEVSFHSSSSGKALWEITDVDNRTEAERFVIVVQATPMSASRATREIPVDRDNSGLLDDIMERLDVAASEEIPDTGLHASEPAPAPVDYRDSLQSDFLDNPNFKI